jgi:hypothetical protein
MFEFSAQFRKAFLAEFGQDPVYLLTVLDEKVPENERLSLLRRDKYTLESILDFVEKALPWMSILYLKYPLETFVLKKTFKSLIKKVRKDIKEKKKKKRKSDSLGFMEEDMKLKSMIGNVVSLHRGEGRKATPAIRTATNKEISSNFTEDSLDYKSQHDFWDVDGEFIVRNFETGDVIDESN